MRLAWPVLNPRGLWRYLEKVLKLPDAFENFGGRAGISPGYRWSRFYLQCLLKGLEVISTEKCQIAVNMLIGCSSHGEMGLGLIMRACLNNLCSEGHQRT